MASDLQNSGCFRWNIGDISQSFTSSIESSRNLQHVCPYTAQTSAAAQYLRTQLCHHACLVLCLLSLHCSWACVDERRVPLCWA